MGVEMTENYQFAKWGTTDLPLLWEDLHRFSLALRASFPTTVIFPPEFQAWPGMEESQPGPIGPVALFDDIYSCVHGFQHYYGWGVCVRLATEEEIASGMPERMIGGRRDPTSYPDEQDLLKCAPQLVISINDPDRCFLRLSYIDRDNTRHLQKPIHDYPAIRMIDYRGGGFRGSVSISGSYAIGDQRAKSFATKIRALLMQNLTKDVALYDPRTRQIVDNAFRYKMWVSRFGLEYCALHEDIYLGKGSVVDGVQTWIGPREKLRDKTRAIGPKALEPRFFPEQFSGWPSNKE